MLELLGIISLVGAGITAASLGVYTLIKTFSDAWGRIGPRFNYDHVRQSLDGPSAQGGGIEIMGARGAGNGYGGGERPIEFEPGNVHYLIRKISSITSVFGPLQHGELGEGWVLKDQGGRPVIKVLGTTMTHHDLLIVLRLSQALAPELIREWRNASQPDPAPDLSRACEVFREIGQARSRRLCEALGIVKDFEQVAGRIWPEAIDPQEPLTGRRALDLS